MKNFSDKWMPYKNYETFTFPQTEYVMVWTWMDNETDLNFDILDERIILYTSTKNIKSYLTKFNKSLLTHDYGISGARSIFEKFIYKGNVQKDGLKFIPDQLYWNFTTSYEGSSALKYKNKLRKMYKEKFSNDPTCCRTDRHKESDLK